MRDPDTRIVEALKQGDRLAFRRFHDERKDAALRLALRILGNREDAEDAVQDAFVDLFRHIDGFREASSLSTWFYRIVVTSCLRVRDRRARRRDAQPGREDTGSDAALAAKAPAAPGPEVSEAARALDAALGRLPERQRVVFCLSEVEGLAAGEVAEVLGIDAGTARYHLSKARARLREILHPFLTLESASS